MSLVIIVLSIHASKHNNIEYSLSPIREYIHITNQFRIKIERVKFFVVFNFFVCFNSRYWNVQNCQSLIVNIAGSGCLCAVV